MPGNETGPGPESAINTVATLSKDVFEEQHEDQHSLEYYSRPVAITIGSVNVASRSKSPKIAGAVPSERWGSTPPLFQPGDFMSSIADVPTLSIPSQERFADSAGPLHDNSHKHTSHLAPQTYLSPSFDGHINELMVLVVSTYVSLLLSLACPIPDMATDHAFHRYPISIYGMSYQSGASRFQLLFEVALEVYRKLTGTLLVDHSLYERLAKCDTVKFITTVLKEQALRTIYIRLPFTKVVKQRRSSRCILAYELTYLMQHREICKTYVWWRNACRGNPTEARSPHPGRGLNQHGGATQSRLRSCPGYE